MSTVGGKARVRHGMDVRTGYPSHVLGDDKRDLAVSKLGLTSFHISDAEQREQDIGKVGGGDDVHLICDPLEDDPVKVIESALGIELVDSS